MTAKFSISFASLRTIFARTPVSVTLIQSSTNSFVQAPNHGDGNFVCYALFGCCKPFTHGCELGIRTYSVVPLNEECGLIEWVRNTIPIRNIFKTLYDRRNLNLHVGYKYLPHLLIPTYLLPCPGKGGNRCGRQGQDYERRRCSKAFRRASFELLPTAIPRMVCRKVPGTHAVVSM